MNGMGSKIVNALSKVFIVESFILGKGRRVEFYDGIPWDKGDSNNEEEIKDPDIYQGTRVTFIPSEVMEKESIITITWQDIFYLINLLLPLTVIVCAGIISQPTEETPCSIVYVPFFNLKMA